MKEGEGEGDEVDLEEGAWVGVEDASWQRGAASQVASWPQPLCLWQQEGLPGLASARGMRTSAGGQAGGRRWQAAERQALMVSPDVLMTRRMKMRMLSTVGPREEEILEVAPV